jgi:large subunit ribosomal protein L9
MEVILLKDVEKLGLRGDVVDVARGYARNYLLPRRMAEVATAARIAELERIETQRARHEARTADQAQEIADVLGKTVLTFEVKAGPTGALFGSVTPSDLVDEIWRARKIRVDRRKIAIDPIKRIGRYSVPIEVYEDVLVEVKTLVVPEGGELPPEEELQALEEAETAAVAEAEAAHVEAETAIADAIAAEEPAEDDESGAEPPSYEEPAPPAASAEPVAPDDAAPAADVQPDGDEQER